MNRWTMKLLIAACICAAGCGDGTMPAAGNQPVDVAQGSGNDTGGANGSNAGATGTAPGVESSNATFELRLRGVDAGDLRLVRLRVQSVEIRARTTVLATELMTSEMDLTQGEQAFLLSTFHAPAAGGEVEFTVALSSASVETANEKFEVDARCEVLKLTGKMSLIAKRNHAVVHLDLARSFVKVGTAMAFVPHLQLVF
jgi:hypothetical protein